MRRADSNQSEEAEFDKFSEIHDSSSNLKLDSFTEDQNNYELSVTKSSLNIGVNSTSEYIYSKSPFIGQVIDEKILEPLDFIEIALTEHSITDKQVISLIVFFKDELMFSTFLIKLLVFYMKIEILEKLVKGKFRS